MADPRPKTIFLDLDGCVFHHSGSLETQMEEKLELLPGVREKFDEWDRKGYNVIIATGRLGPHQPSRA